MVPALAVLSQVKKLALSSTAVTMGQDVDPWGLVADDLSPSLLQQWPSTLTVDPAASGRMKKCYMEGLGCRPLLCCYFMHGTAPDQSPARSPLSHLQVMNSAAACKGCTLSQPYMQHRSNDSYLVVQAGLALPLKQVIVWGPRTALQGSDGDV